jgi:two-component system repressor protein LuxO
MAAHPWPGNVRELENVVERAVLMEDGDTISLASLPDAVVDALAAPAARPPAPGAAASPPRPDDVRPLEEEERRLVLRAIEATGGNIQEAATRLKISRATIYRKMERWGAAPPAGA